MPHSHIPPSPELPAHLLQVGHLLEAELVLVNPDAGLVREGDDPDQDVEVVGSQLLNQFGVELSSYPFSATACRAKIEK